MLAKLYRFNDGQVFPSDGGPDMDPASCNLVLCFADKQYLETDSLHNALRGYFPAAEIVLCSTSGEISGPAVTEGDVSIAALRFDHTALLAQCVNISAYTDSFDAGRGLADSCLRDGVPPKYLLVVSDGSFVNGTDLLNGIHAAPGWEQVLVTGGLAGDGLRFSATLVGLNSPAQQGNIVGIGFFGDKLLVGHGSKGGWDTFGLEKVVTRSDHNILYELDGVNALSVYKRYLGPDASGLPGAALLFPLAVVLPDTGEAVVRTILSVDEEAGTMTFAGDIPMDSRARFMRANFDRLINASHGAALNATLPNGAGGPQYALLISCVGRKVILRDRIEEEVDAVIDQFGGQCVMSGFYSYGELSPNVPGGKCQLHNQTMTITTFYEME
ncbi:FIST signal transduction protein [Chitinophaga rhizosphaerae]|uniref:FIST signal transduction protein n=1 Tax=Chitinophaga rhizosphaerae TaxID=1864947 RepID=UPI000F8022F3|nr:FIST N-terminal domain-containing protein [Chitinophaga rhizosphaerae]